MISVCSGLMNININVSAKLKTIVEIKKQNKAATITADLVPLRIRSSNPAPLFCATKLNKHFQNPAQAYRQMNLFLRLPQKRHSY